MRGRSRGRGLSACSCGMCAAIFVLLCYICFLQSRILHLRDLLDDAQQTASSERSGARSRKHLTALGAAEAAGTVGAVGAVEEEADLHVVFSTGCNAFQHWQAEALLNSALHVGMKCKITRIVVGCDKHVATGSFRTHQGGDADRLINQADLGKSTYPNLAVHIAPSVPEAKEFPCKWLSDPCHF